MKILVSSRRLSVLLTCLMLAALLVACGDNTATTAPTTTAAAATTVAATTTATKAATTTAAATTAVAVTTTTVAGTTTTAAVSAGSETNITSGCVTSYDATKDYFPEKASLKYTTGFKVEYFKNYKVITVLTPWRDSKETFQYVLLQCGTPAPKGFDKALTIEVPVKSVVSLSTSYLPSLEKLGVLDKLVGVDEKTYINNTAVRKLIDDKKVAEVAPAATVNVEKVLELKPDLVFAYGLGDPSSDAHPKLLEAGLKVALDSDYMETNPLGRTEWMKFVSMFFNREGDAERIFGGTATRYEDLVKKAKSVTTKPSVLVQTAYKGTWYVSGGNSFVAKMLSDSGANYIWADDKSTGGVPLSFEAVFDKASNADFWINPGYYSSLNDIQASDDRYASFAPFKNNKVFGDNARVNDNGGNDAYESGVVNPDVILSDLIKIFHPELLPDYKLFYYQQLVKK